MSYYQGRTARTIGLTSRAAHRGAPTTPLLHAVSRSLPRASRTGKNYAAVCGTSVAVVVDQPFMPGAARACRKCSKAISS
jgi:hypothetical protein